MIATATLSTRRRAASMLPFTLSLAIAPSPANAEPAPQSDKRTSAQSSPANSPSTPREAGADQAAADEAAAVAATLAGGSSDTGIADEQKVNLYGFADFTYTHAIGDAAIFSPFDTFAVAHLNLYVGSELGDDWRWLSEVRFMYLPNGSVPAAQPFNSPRIDTTVVDYSDFQRPVRWGGINIERAWLERTLHPLLTIRAGQFLTPYGIWNVDHGSPVIISIQRPYPIGQEVFPQYQTGLELYGVLNLSATQLGYHLTLSNGRGPIDTYQDLDHNKAVGGRLFLRQDTPFGTWTLGVSGYRGQYTQRHTAAETDASGAFVVTYPIDSQYNELSLAADLKWEWGGLLLQGEAMLNDAAYTNGGRPIDPSVQTAGGPNGFAADVRRYGYYGLVGYRTPFWGIMPYFVGINYWYGNPASGAGDLRAGLNIRSTPRVVLKAEIIHVWFYDVPPGFLPPSSEINLQASWSF